MPRFNMMKSLMYIERTIAKVIEIAYMIVQRELEYDGIDRQRSVDL